MKDAKDFITHKRVEVPVGTDDDKARFLQALYEKITELELRIMKLEKK